DVWQSEKDSHNEIVANAMSRDRCEFIKSNMHVCDNDNIDKEDCFAKLRQLLCMLNDRFKQFAPHKQCHSVDESMMPYYGRHGCKQLIKGKPIRFGYKFWCGEAGISIVRWNNNNGVTEATNYDHVHPLRAVERFSREKKKRIRVLQPKLLHSYNVHMGGIDRADKNISLL
ncbi:hypothetical protein ANN_04359, partial [Periplaneta americana]